MKTYYSIHAYYASEPAYDIFDEVGYNLYESFDNACDSLDFQIQQHLFWFNEDKPTNHLYEPKVNRVGLEASFEGECNILYYRFEEDKTTFWISRHNVRD